MEDGTPLYTVRNRQDAKFEFTVPKAGRFNACVRNYGRLAADVTYHSFIGHKVDHGKLTSDQLTPVRDAVNNLRSLLGQVMEEQTYQENRDRMHLASASSRARRAPRGGALTRWHGMQRTRALHAELSPGRAWRPSCSSPSLWGRCSAGREASCPVAARALTCVHLVAVLRCSQSNACLTAAAASSAPPSVCRIGWSGLPGACETPRTGRSAAPAGSGGRLDLCCLDFAACEDSASMATSRPGGRRCMLWRRPLTTIAIDAPFDCALWSLHARPLRWSVSRLACASSASELHRARRGAPLGLAPARALGRLRCAAPEAPSA